MNEVQIAQMIYPSVVTCVGDWKKMLEEVRKLRLAEISLFMTMVGFRERKKIYALLAIILTGILGWIIFNFPKIF